MTTRERIEAIADKLSKIAMGYTMGKDALHDDAKFLRAILADLPAETPPTLEEFRQSGKWFLVKDGMQIDLAMYERRNKAGDWCVLINAMYTERPEPGAPASIARMPRFYPVEGE